MTKKELEKLEDFKVYTFEWDVYVKAEDYKKIAIENKKLKKYYDRDKEELMESCYWLARENDELKADLMEDMKEITELEQENKKLREFKEKREESMFYFKAQMERAEPKTAREAEDLQKAKELFEKLYREELYHLEQENKNLKETNMDLNSALMVSSAEIVRLKKDIEMLSWNIILWYM